MIILKESKSPKASPKKESAEWESSSKDALALAIRKYSSKKVDIFLVGPDRYWIEDGRFIGKNQGINYWIDRNGFICGFDVRTISDRVETMHGTLWSFHIGRQEVQLLFD
jgi:hypothetical protein